MADSDNRQQVQDFFGKHASAYAGNLGKDLERLIALLAPTGTEAALDVATATGSTALALAPLVAAVTGLDLTPAMGREFAAQAAQQGVGNARFIEGDVAHLPFAGGSFDIVTCRRAAHHFLDVPAALAEMARVLRPGGRLGLVDMTVPEDPAAAALLNAMEKARDISHAAALSPETWRAAITAVGLRVQALEVARDEISFERWLAPVAPDSPEAAQAAAAARRAQSAVAAPVVRHNPDGTVTFLKQRVIAVAVKGGR